MRCSFQNFLNFGSVVFKDHSIEGGAIEIGLREFLDFWGDEHSPCDASVLNAAQQLVAGIFVSCMVNKRVIKAVAEA